MLLSYFVVARSSGNIIRITRRTSPPADTVTLLNVKASTASLHCYQALYAKGQDLISLDSVS